MLFDFVDHKSKHWQDDLGVFLTSELRLIAVYGRGAEYKPPTRQTQYSSAVDAWPEKTWQTATQTEKTRWRRLHASKVHLFPEVSEHTSSSRHPAMRLKEDNQLTDLPLGKESAKTCAPNAQKPLAFMKFGSCSFKPS